MLVIRSEQESIDQVIVAVLDRDRDNDLRSVSGRCDDIQHEWCFQANDLRHFERSQCGLQLLEGCDQVTRRKDIEKRRREVRLDARRVRYFTLAVDDGDHPCQLLTGWSIGQDGVGRAGNGCGFIRARIGRGIKKRSSRCCRNQGASGGRASHDGSCLIPCLGSE